MRVQMKTTAAGPDFVLNAGTSYNMPKSLGERFIKSGHAHLAPPGARIAQMAPRPDPEEVETFPEDEEITETE